MASTHKSFRLPTPIWEAFELLCKLEDGPFSEYESPNAAGVGLFLWATTFHQRKHTLGAHVAKFTGKDRDLIYSFVLFAAQNKISLGDMMPKPAKASDILNLAKRWKTPDGFKKPD